MAERVNLRWLLDKLSPQHKLTFYIFLVMGLILIVLGFLVQPTGGGAGFDWGVLAFWMALGLFWMTMGFVHAIIGAMRLAEKGQSAG